MLLQGWPWLNNPVTARNNTFFIIFCHLTFYQGYGMNSYGQADARSLYGGYPGQATQANPYGVAGASAAASPYSNYGELLHWYQDMSFNYV